ncbi:MAG: methylmalonyl Co-A mutase-associated GTPase MeaB, partial [Spirochaetales bacterium]
MDVEGLARDILDGRFRAIAQGITLVENNLPEKENLIRILYPHTGRAVNLGITGAPGSGKSSLVNRLIHLYRDGGKRVGIIAVDPSSPFTRGAILGDRLRMQDHSRDPGVFIRSMASRGHLGGLSSGCWDAVKILDAAGFDTVIIETIGVGQNEVEIMRLSDLVLLVLVPGLGDEIQALKAGVMEIGDVYVINKMDLEGADRLKAEVEYALNFGAGETDGESGGR